MGTIHIDLPERVLLATGQSEEDFVREAKLVVALRLFEQGRVSSGGAAELCGLPRIDFLFAAGRAGVPRLELQADEVRGIGEAPVSGGALDAQPFAADDDDQHLARAHRLLDGLDEIDAGVERVDVHPERSFSRPAVHASNRRPACPELSSRR